MGTGENIDSIYWEKVNEIAEFSANCIKSIITSHFNSIVNKYGNWRRYPRKIKKFLKKKQWWNIKDAGMLNEGLIRVTWKYNNFKKRD